MGAINGILMGVYAVVTGSSESALVKMPHFWKSYVVAQVTPH